MGYTASIFELGVSLQWYIFQFNLNLSADTTTIEYVLKLILYLIIIECK